ncbi:MAG: endonuclease III [Candidatus Neomarinimicrobiota bacterium]|nr:MAG: endonuclease III [bacterium]
MNNPNHIRANKIVNLLNNEYPDSKCSLNYKNPSELLVATILSAQCTDHRVNQVLPRLFIKYPNIESFAFADLKELSKYIFSCGYHNQKAKSIQGSSLAIIEKYNGKVPESMSELLTLPGVGRKTANCILGECFNVPSMVIDTHMIRIMNLLDFTSSKDPKKIELELMKIFNKEHWVKLTHMIIDHGRAVCIARRPKCEMCILSDLCPSSLI